MTTRSWRERGTFRKPGPHLDRMPIGFDVSGISIAEGFRAAIASGVVVLASVWWHSPQSWEPDRLAKEIGDALLAHGRLADAVFSACLGTAKRGDAEQARRAAGVANTDLEASLSGALHEPHRTRNRDLEAGLVIDAANRRLGGALITFQHEVAARGTTDADGMRRWQQRITSALRELGSGRWVIQLPPAAPSDSTLARLRRAIDVIDTARVARGLKLSAALPIRRRCR